MEERHQVEIKASGACVRAAKQTAQHVHASVLWWLHAPSPGSEGWRLPARMHVRMHARMHVPGAAGARRSHAQGAHRCAWLQVYKQKVKHLLYEHQNNITTLKADGELALKLQQDDFRGREVHLGKDKRNLKLELKEQVSAQPLMPGHA